MANIDFPSSPTAGQTYIFSGVTYTYTTQGTWIPSAGSTITAGAASPQGRMTLQTMTPVMLTQSQGVTTPFYTPYVGNRVPIYDGTNFAMRAFTEIVGTTVADPKQPGPILANKVNDWFIWDDAGTLRMCHGVDWTDDSTRASAIVRVQGLWLNASAITNGPAAQRGTYVGTTASSSTAKLDWIYGERQVAGRAGYLGVWNCYNRMTVTNLVGMSSSWTYALNPFRYVNNSLEMRVTYVLGLSEDPAEAIYYVNTATGVNGAAVAVGYDSPNPVSPYTVVGFGAAVIMVIMGTYAGTPAGIGKHFLAPVENTNAGGAITFFQDNGFIVRVRA